MGACQQIPGAVPESHAVGLHHQLRAVVLYRQRVAQFHQMVLLHGVDDCRQPEFLFRSDVDDDSVFDVTCLADDIRHAERLKHPHLQFRRRHRVVVGDIISVVVTPVA